MKVNARVNQMFCFVGLCASYEVFVFLFYFFGCSFIGIFCFTCTRFFSQPISVKPKEIGIEFFRIFISPEPVPIWQFLPLAKRQ